MNDMQLSDREFGSFQQWLHEAAGIHLAPAKKSLVFGRLSRRVHQLGLSSFGDYFNLLTGTAQAGEKQTAIDLLTTNETYFFREPKHFEFLRDTILAGWPATRPFRVWSAACSSGEEPYTIAMTLAERLGTGPWEVLASDLSSRVLKRAESGHYPIERAKDIPEHCLRNHCLRGVGSQDGTFVVAPKLRERVRFHQVNLNTALPQVGQFDVIFLRNVMIYFDMPTKQRVVERLLPHLVSGGYFIVSHSETLGGISAGVGMVRPSIYRKA